MEFITTKPPQLIFFATVFLGATLSITCDYRSRKPADDNSPDPDTGLTPKDKRRVQESWNRVRQDLRGAGLGFFRAFFQTHPEYQNLFEFTGVPMDKLAENKSFVAHALTVMSTISLIVDNLDDVSSLVALLERLGKSHGKRNIGTTHFRNLAVVLVAYLETVLGREYFIAEVKQSWMKTLGIATSVIETKLTS